MRKFHAVSLCMLLASCATGNDQQAAPISSAKPALVGEPFDQVLLRVKQEVGLFQSQSSMWHNGLSQEFQKLGIVPQCGSGDISFQIKTIKMEFATTLDRTISGELGLKIPFGPVGLGNIGPDIKGSLENKGANILDYTYYVPSSPGSLDPVATHNIAAHAVIAPTLSALREGLVRATAQRPCMSDTPKDKDDTFTFAVELTKDSDPKIGFNFAILSANAGVDISNRRVNTITVTFHPTPTGGALMAG